MRTLARSLRTWRGSLWVGGTVMLIAGALAVLFLTGSPDVQAATVSQDYAGDISYGNPDAKVVLLEYADFECGACASYAKLLAPLREEYKDRVLFVFRNFPLQNHPYSTISAQVAYAAHLQGKFWEMHDLLYENQQEWVETSDPRPFFDNYASTLGLDMEKFHADADAQSTLDFINRQAREGSDGGVNHTPWFFLNGESIQPRTAEGFRELIEAQL
jgi:protein-disulfide isomerase